MPRRRRTDEEQRAYWRAKSKRRWQRRNPYDPARDRCIECHEPFAPGTHRNRLRCDECKEMRRRRASTSCRRCSVAIDPGRNGQRRYCTPCRLEVGREARRAYNRRRALTPVHVGA